MEGYADQNLPGHTAGDARVAEGVGQGLSAWSLEGWLKTAYSHDHGVRPARQVGIRYGGYRREKE